MALRVFPTAGEALHFGARRMETMMRIGWAPVLLLFVTQFVSLFALLSVMTGEFVSASDMPVLFNGADAASIFDARNVAEFATLVSSNARMLFKLAVAGQWDALPLSFWAVVAGSVVVQLALVATIVAPMIRLAGLGEEPSPGVLRMKFGEDETRFFLASAGAILVLGAFVLGPLAAALYFTLKSVNEALGAVYAVFPNADSLHTVVERSGREMIEEQGRLPH
ncbi:MAG: hypothetical protein K2Q06_00385, partial [Parvularculaceae bacterium]|nr:hypothetical protein [Parvularculaceae bacterium]